MCMQQCVKEHIAGRFACYSFDQSDTHSHAHTPLQLQQEQQQGLLLFLLIVFGQGKQPAKAPSSTSHHRLHQSTSPLPSLQLHARKPHPTNHHTMSSLMATLRDWQERHKRFVKKVHAFRIPLSPQGKAVAQVVYFSVPVVAGYFIMGWATDRAKAEIQYSDSNDEEGNKTMVFGSARAAAGAEGDGVEAARVKKAMRVAPEAVAMEEQIARQNLGLQSYLDSIRQQKKG